MTADDRKYQGGLADGKSMAVIAGAGTGKTTRLIDEIVALIEKRNVPVGRILAVTFTEAAAADMRQKLRNRLEELWAERRDTRFLSALSSLEWAQISTIHSFSLRILRENPYDAGLDPDFVVEEGPSDILLRDEIWSQWAASVFWGGTPFDDELVGLLKRFSVASLKEIGFMLVARPDRLADYFTYRPDPERLKGQMKDRLAQVRASLSAIHPSVTEPDPLENRFRAVQEILAAGGLSEIADRTARAGLARVGGSPKRFSDPRDYDALKALIDGPDGAIQTLKEAAALPAAIEEDAAVASAIGMLGRFVDFLAEEKRRRGVLSFFDLIFEAEKLLERNATVRKRYQDEFDYILVDEFQDTDPILGDMILFLAEDGQSAKRPDEVMLKKGRLFIVGDPKQSIYRFRDAEVGVFFSVMDKIEASGGTKGELAVNYRSRAHLISFFNAFFAEYIRHTDERYSIDYVKLKADVPDDRAAGTDPTVTVATITPTAKTSVEVIRQIEADWIADRILGMVESQREGKIVRERGNNTVRGVEYRDIAVLFRSIRGVSSYYEEAFKREGIPYFIVGGRGYYQRQEILDVINILTAVFDPTDRRPLIGALRGPVFGVDDRTLYDLSRKGKLTYLASGVDGYVGRVFESLRRLHDLTRRLSLAQLVWAIYDETQIVEVNAFGPGGVQRVGNLVKIARETALLESKGPIVLSAFLSWLRRLSEERDEEGEAVVTEEGKNAVKIMTIHQSKGLEFPIVFIPDLGKRIQIRGGKGIVISRGDTSVSGANLGSAEDLGWSLHIRAIEESRELAEEKRLFYVAATRARDRLILVGCPKEKTSHMHNVLDFIGASSDSAPLPVSVENIDPVALGKYSTARKKTSIEELLGASTEDPAPLELAREREDGRRAECERAMERRLFSFVTEGKDEEPVTGGFSVTSDSDGTGRLVGILVHEVLSVIDLSADTSPGMLIEHAAAGMGLSPDIAGAVIDEARSLLEGFLGSDMRREIRSSRIIGREMPLLTTSDGVTLTGRIDVVYETGDAIVVLDYKTDSVTKEGAAEAALRYKDQITAYVQTLTEAVKDDILVKGGVYFIRPGVFVQL